MTKGIGSSIGGYTIESLLGRGGMSTVFIAMDAKLGRRVALKIMSEELSDNEAFRSRFIREAKMAANLEHPSIVPVYDAGEADDVLYLAMRVIRGTDLRRVIAEQGPMEAERTTGIMRQTASALDAAHRAGLVHRDVKPANILLSHEGEEEHAYLSDFGLTKHVSSRSGLTQTGTFMGTIDYVAPEQIRGDEVDGRTDLYSLACVLYECLTGEVPFTKDQDVAILFAHLEDERPRVSAKRPELSAAIDDVLARAMAKQKEARFDTCLAFVDAARRALELAPAVRGTAPPTILAPPPAAPSPGSEGGREPHPSFPPLEQPSTPPAVSGTAPPAGAAGAGSASGVQVPAPPEASRPAATPVTASPPAAAPPGGRSTKRMALFIGTPLLAIVAVAGIVFAMGGSGQPEPPPPPPAPTGPSPPTTISNAQAIAIPKSGSATPYPSTIEVSDLRGVVTDLNVQLDGFQHAFPSDVDVVLVGPGGQNVDLMNGVGGFGSVSGLTLTFDDEGTPLKPGRTVTSGTFSPSSSTKREGFGFRGPPPAPSPPHGTSLALFNGIDPNGTWDLYVFDDSDRDAGQITGGWR
jgi:serine/threonine protein kinase